MESTEKEALESLKKDLIKFGHPSQYDKLEEAIGQHVNFVGDETGYKKELINSFNTRSKVFVKAQGKNSSSKVILRRYKELVEGLEQIIDDKLYGHI